MKNYWFTRKWLAIHPHFAEDSRITSYAENDAALKWNRYQQNAMMKAIENKYSSARPLAAFQI